MPNIKNICQSFSIILYIIFSSMILISCSAKTTSNANIPAIKTKTIFNKGSNTDDENAAKVNLELGLHYLENNMKSRAYEKILKSFQLAPKLPEVNAAMAYYFRMVNEPLLAKKYYLLAIKYSDSKTPYLNNYAMLLCEVTADFSMANKIFAEALEDKTYIDIGVIYENAGICMYKQKKYANAKAYFTKAISCNNSVIAREKLDELETMK